MRIGIDTGGTFTDFVVVRDNGVIESFKLRSNPASPASVILEGLRRIAAPAKSEVVHGSTVATNALLERKGARTALIATQGFTELVHIGQAVIAHGGKLDYFIDTVFNYPTLAECYKVAALAALKKFSSIGAACCQVL